MNELYDFSLIDWSRAQFALTAMYHWLFVPFTLGIVFVIAIMETIYVKSGDEMWKKMTKFWMTIFGINFAIGVSTGLILEFEFGTNWSNYSWFVGDIFGAPLAIEGIMAFFMESTFIAIMFFGWNKVSKKTHLAATWLTAFGANLSALWILVANAWMQNPVGMQFNPETARNEMVNFWEILFSPTAINKFLHTVASGYVTAGIVVIGISAWFLLKNRHKEFARRSILVGAFFGLIFSVYSIWTGDGSAQQIAKTQPMKLAAMEGLFEGSEGAGLVVVGVLGENNNPENPWEQEVYSIELPGALAYLSFRDLDAFVPGVNDLTYGNPEQGITSNIEKIQRGRVAQNTLRELKSSKKSDPVKYEKLLKKFYDPTWKESYFRYFGYGYYWDKDPAQLRANASELIPHIGIAFYSFHIMVYLGGLFLLIFMLSLYWAWTNKLDRSKRWFYYIAIFSIPLVYVAGQAGWVLAEVGRQPWVIQDLMPTLSAVSQIDTGAVQTTFVLFAIVFTALLIAELGIMFHQIKKGPKTEED